MIIRTSVPDEQLPVAVRNVIPLVRDLIENSKRKIVLLGELTEALEHIAKIAEFDPVEARRLLQGIDV